MEVEEGSDIFVAQEEANTFPWCLIIPMAFGPVRYSRLGAATPISRAPPPICAWGTEKRDRLCPHGVSQGADVPRSFSQPRSIPVSTAQPGTGTSRSGCDALRRAPDPVSGSAAALTHADAPRSPGAAGAVEAAALVAGLPLGAALPALPGAHQAAGAAVQHGGHSRGAAGRRCPALAAAALRGARRRLGTHLRGRQTDQVSGLPVAPSLARRGSGPRTPCPALALPCTAAEAAAAAPD